jgi:hypothetical protein
MRKALIVAFALPLTLLAQDAPKAAEAPKTAAPAATPAAAPEKAAAKAESKAEVKVGTAVEKKELTGAAEEFKVAPDTKLYAWAKVSGLAADSKVTLAFFKGDKEAFKKELTVGGTSWRVNAYKTFREGDGGDWTAKLLGADGAELASVKFKVEIQK